MGLGKCLKRGVPPKLALLAVLTPCFLLQSLRLASHHFRSFHLRHWRLINGLLILFAMVFTTIFTSILRPWLFMKNAVVRLGMRNAITIPLSVFFLPSSSRWTWFVYVISSTQLCAIDFFSIFILPGKGS